MSKPVFLVKVAPCDTDGLFNDVQYVDLTMEQAEGYQRLARGLDGIGIESGDSFEWNLSRPCSPGLLALEEKAYFLKKKEEGQAPKKAMFTMSHRLLRTIDVALSRRTNFKVLNRTD